MIDFISVLIPILTSIWNAAIIGIGVALGTWFANRTLIKRFEKLEEKLKEEPKKV